MSKLLFLISVLTLVLGLAGFGSAQTSTMSWSAGPNLGGARSSSAAVVNNDGIYVFGGSTATPTSVEKLVNGTNFWQLLPTRCSGRRFFTTRFSLTGRADFCRNLLLA